MFVDCPSCQSLNDPKALSCWKCGFALKSPPQGPQAGPGPAAQAQGPTFDMWNTPYYSQFPDPSWPYDTIWKPPGQHNVGIAILLGFFLAGFAGQFYNGQVGKGVVGLVLLIVSFVVSCGMLTPTVWLVLLMDAGSVAHRLSKGIPVKPWSLF